MSSPNEPGTPRTGDGPAGPGANSSNGAHDGPSGDVPPWQRGTARSRPARGGGGAPSQDAPAHEGSRSGTATGHNPGTDARLNRFIAGGPATQGGSSPAPTRESAPARDPEPAAPAARSDRAESARSEVYASELPDLSGPTARPTRKSSAERPAQESSSRSAPPRTQAGRAQGPVRASMQIRRFDPWSVLKVSLILSVALFFVWMIAVAFLYLVLGAMGVWSKLNTNVGDLLTSGGGSSGELVSSGAIFGGAAMIGLVNIVLLTAMATCGAFIYNLTTDLVGGVEVTLADRD